MTLPPEGTVRLNVHIPKHLHAAFKAAAALRNQRMTDVMVDFIEEYVRRNLPLAMKKDAKK